MDEHPAAPHAERRSTVPRAFSGALRVYLQVVVAAGAVILGLSAAALPATPRPLEWLLFGVLAVLAGSFTIKVATVEAWMSVADTFFITSAVLFGPGPATIAVAIDSFIRSSRRGNAWLRRAFNAVAPAISMWAAGQVFFLAARVAPLTRAATPLQGIIFPLLWLTTVYFVLNSGFVAVAVGLDKRQSPFTIWNQHFSWLSLSYLAAGSASFCLILLIHQISLSAVAVVLPLVAVFYLTLRASFGRLEDARRHLGDLDRLYLSTVETLAMAIDAKDDVTHSHVRRVQAYAVGLARALGISDEPTIKAIEAAALLHDTGKLAVPEHILNKPGKLTASEFEKMKLHVDIGADILSLVQFPYPVVPIVRCHHESWDGSGYPRGVAGKAIPIGARILSVVDCFDALTSDRPYRRAMTSEGAVAILRERSGVMYDPEVVETFISIYPQLQVHGADTPEHREVLQRITQTRKEQPVQAAAAPTAAADELLAFVSLARIASGDGNVGDVLALSSSLIGDVAPGRTGAWYLPDAAGDRLVIAEAFGPAAVALSGVSVGIGQRLTGWVAATRQSIADADAALDLEASVDSAQGRLDRCMSVPLMTGDALVGVLTLYAQAADGFDEHHSRLIQMVAPHIARAIDAASRSTGGSRSTSTGRETPPERVPTITRDPRPVSVH
jgi:putative nucleotidyltransferase with HDIG domain